MGGDTPTLFTKAKTGGKRPGLARMPVSGGPQAATRSCHARHKPRDGDVNAASPRRSSPNVPVRGTIPSPAPVSPASTATTSSASSQLGVEDPDDDVGGGTAPMAAAVEAGSLPTAWAHQRDSLHWAVTEAFHASLRYVLHYAGPALPPEQLWVCRSLLQLAHRSPAKSIGGQYIGDGGCTGNAKDPLLDMLWESSDEVELLLRLALRKPASFTVRSVEAAFGEQLHVHTALRALGQSELIHWRDAADHAGSEGSPREQRSVTLGRGQKIVSPSGARKRERDEGSPDSGDGAVVVMSEAHHAGGGAPGGSPETHKNTHGSARHPASARPHRKRRQRKTLASPMIARHAGSQIADMVMRWTPTPQPPPLASFRTGAHGTGLSSTFAAKATAAAASHGARARVKPTHTDSVGEGHDAHASSGSGTPCQVDSRHRAEMENTLLSILRAARSVDLRACAAALHRCCCARHQQRQQQDVGQPHEQQLRQEPDGNGKEKTSIALREVGREESSDSVLILTPPPQAHEEGTRSTSKEESEKPAPTIPTRKREVILYLIERRYLLVRASASPFSSSTTRASGTVPVAASSSIVALPAAEERGLFAQCWDTFIGDCVTVEAAVKSSVAAVAELFHVVTGNFGSGGPLATMSHTTLPTAVVATPPQMLFTGQQYRMLAHCVHRGLTGGGSGSGGCRGKHHVTFSSRRVKASGVGVVEAPFWLIHAVATAADEKQLGDGVPHPVEIVRATSNITSTPYATAKSFFVGHCADVLLFSSAETLKEYRRALSVHRAAYEATLGAATVAQKLRARDPVFIRSLYSTVIDALILQRRDSARQVREQVAAVASAAALFAHAPRRSTGAAPLSIHAVLHSYGLRAQALLQFTPTYRWYAALDLLLILLQSAHMYEEACTALHWLLEVPLYTVYPAPKAATAATTPDADASDTGLSSFLPDARFPIYYRPQKRGDWLLRLAQNLVHLRRKEQALTLLEEKHEVWRQAWEEHRTNDTLRNTLASIMDDAAAPLEDTQEAMTGIKTGTTMRVASATAYGGLTFSASVMDSSSGGGWLRRKERLVRLQRPLPEALQRRARLLRAIWPDTENEEATVDRERTTMVEDLTIVPSEAKLGKRATTTTTTTTAAAAAPCATPLSRALYHACVEYQLTRYMRRDDVLAMERTLSVLHRALRKWTPLPARYVALTAATEDVARRYVPGVRDAADAQMWLEPESHRQSAMRVEPFVMEHYLREWNALDGIRRAKDNAVPITVGEAVTGGDDDHVNGHRGQMHEQADSHASRAPRPESVHKSPREVAGEGSREDTHAHTHADEGSGASSRLSVDHRDEERQEGTWTGLHCEGAWIAHAARVLLWGCYYHPLAPHVSDSAASPLATTTTTANAAAAAGEDEHLWLSPFQDGPLDLLCPLEFTARRRQRIAARLSYFEGHPKDVMLRYAAAHLAGQDNLRERFSDESRTTLPKPEGVDGVHAYDRRGKPRNEEEHLDAGRPLTLDLRDGLASAANQDYDVRPERCARIEETGEEEDGQLLLDSSEPSSRFEGKSALIKHHSVITALSANAAKTHNDEAMDSHAADVEAMSLAQVPLPLSPSLMKEAACASVVNTHASARCADTRDGVIHTDPTVVPDVLKLNPGCFPLMDLLHAIPKRPLLKLLRVLFLSDLADGYAMKFSGFPDLVLWRRGPANPLMAVVEEPEKGVDSRNSIYGGLDRGGAPVVRTAARSTTADRCATLKDGSVAKVSDTFRLIEVKSPHDSLSTRQITINDCLQRCGFDVSVAHVVDVAVHAEERVKCSNKARGLAAKAKKTVTVGGGASSPQCNTHN